MSPHNVPLMSPPLTLCPPALVPPYGGQIPPCLKGPGKTMIIHDQCLCFLSQVPHLTLCPLPPCLKGQGKKPCPGQWLPWDNCYLPFTWYFVVVNFIIIWSLQLDLNSFIFECCTMGNPPLQVALGHLETSVNGYRPQTMHRGKVDPRVSELPGIMWTGLSPLEHWEIHI